MAKASEVWIINLGMVAKVRPCLLLTNYPADDELALVTVLPHTTALRGNRWELSVPKSFLKPGAFHLQQVQSVSVARLERRLGVLTPEEWTTVQGHLAQKKSIRLRGLCDLCDIRVISRFRPERDRPRRHAGDFSAKRLSTRRGAPGPRLTRDGAAR